MGTKPIEEDIPGIEERLRMMILRYVTAYEQAEKLDEPEFDDNCFNPTELSKFLAQKLLRSIRNDGGRSGS